MKELQDIIAAYEDAEKTGLQTALATVVHVDGSSYRRAGARMLISEDGKLTGAISGGCLEGDALRKARLVMIQQKPMLVAYDTTDDDDAQLGVQLGCNGIIHILIEPLNPLQENNPVSFFKKYLTNRERMVILTVFNMYDSRQPQPGTCLLIDQKGDTVGYLPQEINVSVFNEVTEVLQTGDASTKIYSNQDHYTCFIELLQPPVSLIVAGAGNDARPLIEIAGVLGWEVTLVDGRANYNTAERFPEVKKRIIARPDQALKDIFADDRTAFMLMTHNYNYDLELLKQLIPSDIPYIGVLGPKKRLDRMLEEICNGPAEIENMGRIHGPAGFDIGSENAEQIALSILAEIQSVFSNLNGRPLRDKQVVHDRDKEHVIQR